MKVLHLEDDRNDAELVRATLAGQGIDCEVLRVQTRDDFLSALEQGGPDLIFSDFTLPMFDGISALEIARAKCPHTPFLFISGTLGEEVAIETLKQGATDYVLKGRLSRLVPAVRRALSETRERLGREQAESDLRNLNEELEHRVRERTAELEAANQELEAFSNSVSHDLRAPLRAIDGYTQMIREGYADKLDEEGRRLIDVVCFETQRMARWINDLMGLARLGRCQMTISSIDMTALAETVFEEVKNLSPQRNLRSELDRLPLAHGDPALIRQVFVNLLSNAVKFTRDREPALIEIGGWSEPMQNTYYVKDNGAGFDMNYVGKLFGVFQRLHSEKDFEGTGVGLALVQRIIHRHGGRVAAEAKINEGATFYFTLPNQSTS